MEQGEALLRELGIGRARIRVSVFGLRTHSLIPPAWLSDVSFARQLTHRKLTNDSHGRRTVRRPDSHPSSGMPAHDYVPVGWSSFTEMHTDRTPDFPQARDILHLGSCFLALRRPCRRGPRSLLGVSPCKCAPHWPRSLQNVSDHLGYLRSRLPRLSLAPPRALPWPVSPPDITLRFCMYLHSGKPLPTLRCTAQTIW